MKSILLAALLAFLASILECSASAEQCRNNAETVEEVAKLRDGGTPSWNALSAMLATGFPPSFAGQVIDWVYNKEPEALPIEFKETILKECRILERREKARKH